VYVERNQGGEHLYVRAIPKGNRPARSKESRLLPEDASGPQQQLGKQRRHTKREKTWNLETATPQSKSTE